MHDCDGQTIAIGDRINILPEQGLAGVVVCSIDTGEGTPDHPIEQWGYLRNGVMVDTDAAGLIHVTDSSKLRLLGRSSHSGTT